MEDLCERASRRAMLEELYPVDDAGSAFSEISVYQMTSLIQIVTALNKKQTELKETADKIPNLLDEHRSQNTHPNASNCNFRRPCNLHRSRGGFYLRQQFNPSYQFNKGRQMQQPFKERS